MLPEWHKKSYLFCRQQKASKPSDDDDVGDDDDSRRQELLERNRAAASRSRARKKQMVQNVREQNTKLAATNKALVQVSPQLLYRMLAHTPLIWPCWHKGRLLSCDQEILGSTLVEVILFSHNDLHCQRPS